MTLQQATNVETQAETLGRVAALLADLICDPMLICDRDGRVLVANAALEDLVARARHDMIGRWLGSIGFFEPETVGSWMARDPVEKSSWIEEARIRTPEGETSAQVWLSHLRWGRERSSAFAVTIVSESAVVQPYRLSDALTAVGRYAGRVGHDMRNPITGVSAGLQYLRRLLKENPDHRETLDLMLEEVHRLDETVARLVELRATPEPSVSLFRPDAALSEALARCRESLEEKRLTVAVRVDPMVPSLPGDPEQMTRAIVALVDRAAEAATEDTTLRAAVRLRPRRLWSGGTDPETGTASVTLRCETSLANPRELVEALDPCSPTWSSQADLYLAARMIKANGGWLDLSGIPGRSLAFSVILPIGAR